MYLLAPVFLNPVTQRKEQHFDGLILLAQKLSNDERVHFGTLPVTVKRNAYGRQLGSFCIEQEVAGVGKMPLVFIRAPYIESVGAGVDVLAEVDGNIVGVQYGNQIGIAFHPEVTDCTDMHAYFLEICKNYAAISSCA